MVFRAGAELATISLLAILLNLPCERVPTSAVKSGYSKPMDWSLTRRDSYILPSFSRAETNLRHAHLEKSNVKASLKLMILIRGEGIFANFSRRAPRRLFTACHIGSPYSDPSAFTRGCRRLSLFLFRPEHPRASPYQGEFFANGSQRMFTSYGRLAGKFDLPTRWIL